MTHKVYNLTKSFFCYLNREKSYLLRRYYSNRSYKVLFFGSDSIAYNCLEKINELKKSENLISRLDIVTANTTKNRSAVEKYAESEKIPVLRWPLHNFQNLEYDVGLIAAFGHLITKDVLDKFPLVGRECPGISGRVINPSLNHFNFQPIPQKTVGADRVLTINYPARDRGMVNVHPSLLPRWRGAAPIIHTLLHGDQVTGVSLMKIKADKFDVGEIISQERVPVPKDITLPELTDQLSRLSAEMLAKCMRTLPESLANAVPQSSEGVTYAKKIYKSISEVKWTEMTSVEVYNLYRAIYGLYPLSSKFRDKHVKLFDAFLDHNNAEYQDTPIGAFEFCEEKCALRVLCKDKKYIYFRSIRIVGRKQISAVAFHNGYIKNMPLDQRLYILG